MNLKIPVKVTDENKFLKMLTILSTLSPFDKLRPREKQVFSELLYWNDKYKELPERQRNKLIFDYDVRRAISEKHDMSIDVVYNIMKDLKQKGFITGKSISPSMIIPNLTSITFTLDAT
jgi:hypothetical protein